MFNEVVLPVSDRQAEIAAARAQGNLEAIARHRPASADATYLEGYRQGVLDREGLVPLRMTGRCSSGAERDGGVRYHAVTAGSHYSWVKALCGAKPGDRGNGWGGYKGDKVTCPRCLKKLSQT